MGGDCSDFVVNRVCRDFHDKRWVSLGFHRVLWAGHVDYGRVCVKDSIANSKA